MSASKISASARERRLHADRQRRQRERQRRNLVVVPVEIGLPIIEALLDLGWLAAQSAEDRIEIGDAIGRLLDDMAAHRK